MTPKKQAIKDKDFSKPWPVDPITVAFPAEALSRMPNWETIPEEFKDRYSDNKWRRFVADWFFHGIIALKIDLKDGIDKDIAWSHLQSIIGSFEPKHEHKEAAVAYLASLWFNEIKYEIRAKQPKTTG